MQATADTGLRDNLTLEGPGLTPDGHRVWWPWSCLRQDGPVPANGPTGGPAASRRWRWTVAVRCNRAHVPRAPLVPGTLLSRQRREREVLIIGQPPHAGARAPPTTGGQFAAPVPGGHATGRNTLDQPQLLPGQYQPMQGIARVSRSSGCSGWTTPRGHGLGPGAAERPPHPWCA